MTDWTDGQFADGRLLVAWAYEKRPDIAVEARWMGESWTRRLYDWKRGANPGVDTVDRFCLALGLHLSETPDEIWVDQRPRRDRKRPTKWEHRRAIEMLEEGYLPTEVAAALGVTPRTITNWRQRVAA